MSTGTNEQRITQNNTIITNNNTEIDELKTAINNLPSKEKSYPPDWSKIGYEDAPQALLDDFAYSKEIYDNWDSSQTSMYQKFYNNQNLKYMPLVDTSNVTDMENAFASCTNLIYLPSINTSKVTNMARLLSYSNKLKSFPLINTSKVNNAEYMFNSCTSLVNLPVLDMRNLRYSNNVNYMFSGCSKLSNESLNNILAMCIGMTSYTGTKTLKQLSLTSAQATTCQSLSNWDAFVEAGWSSGY